MANAQYIIHTIAEVLELLATAPDAGGNAELSEALEQDASELATKDERRQGMLKALRADASNTDAAAVLMDEWPMPERIRGTRELLRIARTKLGDRFEKDAGHFWMVPETRPYMRHLSALFEYLWRTEAFEEAVLIGEEALRLCPTDNCGIRGGLTGVYLKTNQHDRAESLLARYEDDATASLVWAKAILESEKGKGDISDMAFEQALERCPRVVPILLRQEELIDFRLLDAIGSYTLGGFEEAYIAACELAVTEAQYPRFFKRLQLTFRPPVPEVHPCLLPIIDFYHAIEQDLPVESIEKAVELGNEVVPDLFKLLERGISRVRVAPTTELLWQEEIPLLLLGEIGASSLIKTLHRLYRYYGEEADEGMLDYTTEEMQPSLVNALRAAKEEGTLEEAMDDLKRFWEDIRCSIWARATCIGAADDAVTLGILEQQAGRDLVSAWFSEGPRNEATWELWDSFINMCSQHNWTEFMPQIEAVFSEAWVPDDAEGLTIVKNEFGMPLAPSSFTTLATCQRWIGIMKAN